MKYTQGNAAMIAKARADAISIADFYGMDGDGCQAPGAIVIRDCGEQAVHRYVVHFANTQDGGFYFGEYTNNLLEARGWLIARAMRYDPSGKLNQSFRTLCGVCGRDYTGDELRQDETCICDPRHPDHDPELDGSDLAA